MMTGALSKKGAPRHEVLADLEARAADDVDWKRGRILTGLYDPGESAYQLTVDAYTRFLTPNALYINMYPSLGRIEQEVVRSVAELLRGDEAVVGNITSGGTESILMAVKTARDHARANRPEVKEPEMVLPITAHPAFHKAAHYLGLRVVVTPVDPVGYRADVGAMAEAITPATVLAVGSAPNFSHGTVDPIPEMAAAARERGVLFHVDGCVGGLYLSFLRRLGEPVQNIDFSVPGVTSISADLHKYGYAPKNASVILYRDRDLRKHALFVCTGTTEYAVINPTAQSSRTGGPIAASWAAFRHLGEEGFATIVRECQEATRRILRAVAEMEGIEVLGDPEMCMFTLGSDSLNVFEIDDVMRLRGWSMIPQFACGGSPANVHVSVSQSNLAHIDAFIDDLQEVVTRLRSEGSSLDEAALGKAVAQAGSMTIEEIFAGLAPLAGLTGEGLPERMAPLNTMLDHLPAPLRDQLLATYINMTT
jgi:glutamate/tyrosine decarboxylase-like PLP-dependent enzyme